MTTARQDGGESGTLRDCRAAIDRADADLIALLARRQQLVRAAAAAKGHAGAAAYDPARERFVLADRERRAVQSGLPPGLITDVLRRVLRESYRQEIAGQTYACACPRPMPTVVIVGGRGGMGKIFGGYFARSGYRVRACGRGDRAQWPTYLARADVVMVTVPIDVTIDVIKTVGPLLPANAVLCDLTSVKAPAVAAMLAAHRGPVLGLHPMFGPDVTSLIKQVIVTVAARDADASAYVRAQLAAWGATLCACDAAEHDRAMGVIQALRHFTTYCYGVFLAGLAPDLTRILALSSPIYRLELMMVGRLFAQDPTLYADIIMASAANRELIARYADCLRAELDTVVSGDRDEFVRRFLAARAYFGPRAGDFMRMSGQLLAHLQDERG